MKLGELSLNFALPLLNATRSSGYDPVPVLERFSITPEMLDSQHQWISISRFMRLGHALIELTGNPALGLKAGEQSRLYGLGLCGYAAMTAGTLGEALSLLARFEPLYGQNIRGQSRYLETTGECILRFYSIAPYNEYNRFVVDSVLSSWYQLCQLLTGSNNQVREVHFEFPAPHYVADYVDAFCLPVLFGQSHNQLILTADAASTPCLLGNSADHMVFVSQCEQRLHSLAEWNSYRSKTAQLIATLLPQMTPSLNDIAGKLHLPAWTLRRKLQEETTSFKHVLDETRESLASAWLKESDHALSEIAFMTGFSSTEAFQRAFKRWCGITPGEFRRQHQTGRRNR